MSEGDLGFKLRVTFITPVLGSQATRDIGTEFIAKRAGIELPADEVETLPEALERGMTVFHRDKNGDPLLVDYQVKGFVKASAEVYNGRITPQGGRKPVHALRSKVVKTIFIFPRFIPLHVPNDPVYENEIDDNDVHTRPLRGRTPQGERVSIAMSEQLPAGTWFECQIEVKPSDIDEKVLSTLLDYGFYQGIGQRRGDGYGRFRYELTAE